MNTELITKYITATPVNLMPINVRRVLESAATKWLATNEKALAEELARLDTEIADRQAKKLQTTDALSLISTKTVTEILTAEPIIELK